MAVNPLARKEYYVFSNMYDDSLITDFFQKINSETYTRSIKYQQAVIGRTRYASDNAIVYDGRISDLVIDEVYNRTAGLAPRTRTLRFNQFVIPVYNKKKMIDTYGVLYPKIPLMDTIIRTDIFDKGVYLTIGAYTFWGGTIVSNTDGTVTIALESTAECILNTNLETMISNIFSDNEKIWVFTHEHNQTFSLTNTYSAALENDPGNPDTYIVTVPLANQINSIGTDPTLMSNNSWDVYATPDIAVYGTKTMIATNCSLYEASGSNLKFSVAKAFIDPLIATNPIGTLMFIAKPSRTKIFIIHHSMTNAPIIFPEYNDNPPSNINIAVYEYEESNTSKGRRLYKKNFAQLYFPNILDFSPLIDDPLIEGDLLVEITEYSPNNTAQIMQNSLAPLIESMGDQLYSEMVVNTNMGRDWGFRSYCPTDEESGSAGYNESEYFGDIRGFMLSKIEKVIKSDPYLFNEYHQWMQNIDRKVVTKSGTPKNLRFGTTLSGEFKGANPIVNDTSVASIDPNDILVFDTPHSYFTYRADNKRVPSMVYINGKYVRPTCTRYYDGNSYLFFPVSLIENEMNSKIGAVWTDEDDAVAAAPITIDTFTNAYEHRYDVPQDYISVEGLDEEYRLFKDEEDRYFTLGELVMYNTETGEYVDWRAKFKLIYEAIEIEIENTTATEKLIVSKDIDMRYFLTALSQLFKTQDDTAIIVSQKEVELDLLDFIEDTGGNMYRDYLNKRLNFADVKFVPKDVSLIGINVGVYSNKYKDEVVKKGSDSTHEMGGRHFFTFKNALSSPYGYNTLSQYAVYVDGVLDTRAEVINPQNKINSDAEVYITKPITDDSTVVFVHLPMGFETANWEYDMVDDAVRLVYMKPVDGYLDYGDPVESLWPVDATDATKGLILKRERKFGEHNGMRELLPMSDDSNPKFTSDGYRLPPMSKNTNTGFTCYYDGLRASVLPSHATTGIVYFTPTDTPFIDYNSFASKNILDLFYQN